MENTLEIKTVPFMGTDLMAARDSGGQIWAGVKWMCNGIGLSKNQTDNQVQKIQIDKVLSKGAGNFPLPTKGGTQEALCLKLDFVPLWLAKISITPTMVAETPDLAANLEQYQLRAKDVLAAAFLPKEHREPKSAMDMLRLQSQALFELDDRLTGLEDKVENQMTIDHGQQRNIQKAVASRIDERMAEAIPAKEINDKKRRFFAALYHDIKDRFGVPSYRDIRPMDYASAIAYVQSWIEPALLRDK